MIRYALYTFRTGYPNEPHMVEDFEHGGEALNELERRERINGPKRRLNKDGVPVSTPGFESHFIVPYNPKDKIQRLPLR